MSYTEEEARRLVVDAGIRLVKEGLTARTWGNISARISDSEFIITPSGMAYESLRPGDLVRCRIEDCSYEGEIKPSSEKWIHADAYRLRSDVDFIIHTHQPCASAVSVRGHAVTVNVRGAEELLGSFVPCAGYGISSTKKLRHEVEQVVKKYPRHSVFLMRSHGTFVLAKSEEDAFRKARMLEEVCENEIEWAGGKTPFFDEHNCHQPYQIPDYGSSIRSGRRMRVRENGRETEYHIGELPQNASPVVLLHEAVYRADRSISCILHNTAEDVAAYSAAGKILPPYLDDLAQVAGTDIRCVRMADLSPKKIISGLRGRNAVLIRYGGALTTGRTRADAEAVGMILEKACKAAIYDTADSRHPHHYLGKADALLQRMFYQKSYSKRIGQSHGKKTDGR